MHLFDELQVREVTLRNRIVVSPMCEYSSTDGFATDWHLVHLGSRAVGGASLVFAEACAVSPEGRISPEDLGIWKDEHIEPLARITRFIREQGAIPGIQLAHAGRKGKHDAPLGRLGNGTGIQRWLDARRAQCHSLRGRVSASRGVGRSGIREIVKAFVAAARRACLAGFGVVEIHSAHGYLLHEFLSPLSNQRRDGYGGSFENRTRLVCEVVTAVRRVWPESAPLFLRISATDWIDGGWDLAQSVQLAKLVGPLGVDLIDCSSGGISPGAKIPVRSGYQVPFAGEIRRQTGLLTGAVGLITTAAQAHAILQEGKADVVLLAREFLRQPYWPLYVANELGVPISWPSASRARRHARSRGLKPARFQTLHGRPARHT